MTKNQGIGSSQQLHNLNILNIPFFYETSKDGLLVLQF